MIVGLTGKMGAGKNETARRLALLTDVVEVSFAAKLKQSVAAVLGCTIDEIERWKNEPFNVSVESRVYGVRRSQTFRSFLQRYGTEGHREIFGYEFWLDAALPIRDYPDGSIAYDVYGDALYVVTDVRFENEAARVRKLGGYLVRVVGPNVETGSHASERELSSCEFEIDNTVRDDEFVNLDRQCVALLDRIGIPARRRKQ